MRIVIDNQTSEWTADGLRSHFQDSESKAGGDMDRKAVLLPETLASFLSVIPGRAGSDADVLRWCRESELRIRDSGYVYEIAVLPLPPRKNQGERTILVTATSGFLWRFGGGNVWGMFGKEGLGGTRSSLRAYAGWNKNGVEYMNYHVGGIPLVIGGRLIYNGPGKNPVLKETAGITAGWLLDPDLIAGTETSWILPDFPSEEGMIFASGPFVRYRKYLVTTANDSTGNEGDLGVDFHGSAYPGLKTAKTEVSAFVHFHPGLNSVLALACACGSSARSDYSGGIPVAAAFDLYYTDDRSVRAGYNSDELAASSFVYGSIELRQKLFSVPFSTAISCNASAFLFSDLAGLIPLNESVWRHGERKYADAYGAGVRVLFDNPVFAYFTFSYGVNHEGAARLLFCATAGY